MQKLESLLTSNFQFQSAQDLSSSIGSCAVVSIIFRKTAELEVLFIRRAHNPDDKWSGQIAFPGGRMEDQETHIQTAHRECLEEIGYSLNSCYYLGSLDDIQGRNSAGLQPFYVRPLVFWSNDESYKFNLDPSEVDDVFWLEVRHLLDSVQHKMFQPTVGGQKLEMAFPGIDLPSGDTLWGLSYLMMTDLLNKAGQRPDFWKELKR